jgi:pyruvate/oxaloacetate carboxyltransferase
MSEIKIDASELKGEGNETIQALADFLREKTSADVKTEGKKMTVKSEGDIVTKKYMRVLLKKFLHKRELKETFRVISDDEENTLKVKEKKVYEEE